MNDFKAAIEALPVKIGFIRHIFVGLNTNSAENGIFVWIVNSIRWQMSMPMPFIRIM